MPCYDAEFPTDEVITFCSDDDSFYVLNGELSACQAAVLLGDYVDYVRQDRLEVAYARCGYFQRDGERNTCWHVADYTAETVGARRVWTYGR